MDMVIEGTCVACAIDRTGYMQQKKQTLLKRIYSSFNPFAFLKQCFKREEYKKNYSCLSSSVIPDIFLCLSLPMENEVCFVCAYLESKIITIKYA